MFPILDQIDGPEITPFKGSSHLENVPEVSNGSIPRLHLLLSTVVYTTYLYETQRIKCQMSPHICV